MSEVGKDLIQSANEVLNGEVRYIKLKRRNLVYCEDCKYWVKRKDYKDLCTYWAINTEEMDFCSRGELK